MGEDGPLLRPVPRGQPLPLSFAQQRLWMVEQMNPGRSGYHVGLRLRLEGTLSLSALRWAIVELVRRHESLRTRFPMGDDGPVQEIATDWEPSLDEIDFSESGSLERAEAEALLDAAGKARAPMTWQKDHWCAGGFIGLTARDISCGWGCIISSPMVGP